MKEAFMSGLPILLLIISPGLALIAVAALNCIGALIGLGWMVLRYKIELYLKGIK